MRKENVFFSHMWKKKFKKIIFLFTCEKENWKKILLARCGMRNLASLFFSSRSPCLRKTFENSLFEQINEFTSSIVINDEKKWKMNDIFDVRKFYRRVQFFVKWIKHDENKIWYDSKRFRNAFDIIKEFYDRYFDKSKSNWLKINQKIWWFKKKVMWQIFYSFLDQRKMRH